MPDKIKALLIYEILGRPAEHIKKSLEDLINKIGENPGIEIIKNKIHEPHLLEEKDRKTLETDEQIFSTFAEVELDIDNLNLVYTLIINTLPSSIEIMEPSQLNIKNFDLSSALSELTIKLHKFDEIAKALAMDKGQLLNVIKEMNKKITELGGESMVKFETEDEVDVKEEGKEKEGKEKEEKENKNIESSQIESEKKASSENEESSKNLWDIDNGKKD